MPCAARHVKQNPLPKRIKQTNQQCAHANALFMGKRCQRVVFIIFKRISGAYRQQRRASVCHTIPCRNQSVIRAVFFFCGLSAAHTQRLQNIRFYFWCCCRVCFMPRALRRIFEKPTKKKWTPWSGFISRLFCIHVSQREHWVSSARSCEARWLGTHAYLFIENACTRARNNKWT